MRRGMHLLPHLSTPARQRVHVGALLLAPGGVRCLAGMSWPDQPGPAPAASTSGLFGSPFRRRLPPAV